MRRTFLALVEHLRYSYWLVPALMVAGAAVLAAIAGWIDGRLLARRAELPGWIYTGGAEGAREVLSTVASSTITVAGVVFSITIVALTLASSQLGPRLLRTFMRDRGSQVTLGTLLAAFVYCLLVVRTVRGGNGDEYVPHLSVTIAVALALCSLGALIYFIHHAASSIQAPNVIATVARDLDRVIEVRFPRTLGLEPAAPRSGAERGWSMRARDAAVVDADRDGYVQIIDEDEAMALASAHDVVIEVVCSPGRFVFAGRPLARVWPRERCGSALAAAVRDAFVVGDQRSIAQDVEFAVEQLVEVAVRALSPGVNDPFTAIQCVERLGAGLARLAQREPPSPYRLDGDGRLRVIATPITFRELLSLAVDPIRQHARESVGVTARLLDLLAPLAEALRRDDDRAAVLEQVHAIARQHHALPDERDRAAVRRRCDKVLEGLRPQRT